jgi:integrase
MLWTSPNFYPFLSIITQDSRTLTDKVIQHFKAVFNHAFNNEYIARNPSRNYKQLKLDFKEMDYLSQEEMNQLLSYTNQKYSGADRWKHVLYLTLFLTGARLGEVLGLEWHRIQPSTNTILIGQIWCAISNKIINTTKGKKDRVIPLNSLLKKELGAMKNHSKRIISF